MNVSSLTLPPKPRLSSLVSHLIHTLHGALAALHPGQMQTALPPHLPSLSFCFSKCQHTKHPLSLVLHSSLFNPHPRSPALLSCYVFAYYAYLMEAILAQL